MENQEYSQVNLLAERTISLRSLWVRCLLRGKIILLCTIACALLAGAYGYHKAKLKPTEEKENFSVLDSEEYYQKMKDTFARNLAKRYEYMNHSLLKDVNPYEYKVLTQNYYVQSPTNSPEDSDGQMALIALREYAKNGINWDILKQEANVAAGTYLQELVQAEIEENTLQIKLIVSEPDLSQKMMDIIEEGLKNQFALLQKKAAMPDYRLLVLERRESVDANWENSRWLAQRMAEINELETSRDTFVKSYAAASVLQNGSPKNISWKKVAKWTFAGALLGGFLSFLGVALKIILSGTVLSGTELSHSWNLPMLANISISEKGRRQRILNLESENSGILSAEVQGELLHNYLLQTKTLHSINFLSDQKGEEVSELMQKLTAPTNLNYFLADNILADVKQRETFAKCDGVILLVKKEVSTYRSVCLFLTLAQRYHKEVIGFIVYE